MKRWHLTAAGLFAFAILAGQISLSAWRGRQRKQEESAGVAYAMTQIALIADPWSEPNRMKDAVIRARIARADQYLQNASPFAASHPDLMAGLERTCKRLDSGQRPDETQGHCEHMLSFLRACQEKARASAKQ